MLLNNIKRVYLFGGMIIPLICNAVFSLSITHGPYLVDQTETAVTVLWFTDENTIGSIEYGTGGSFSLTADDVTRGIMNVGTRHEARITGLSAGTTYNYRVRATEVSSYVAYFPVLGSTVKSANSEFTTFDTGKAVFSFYFLTDLHNNTAWLNTLLDLADWDDADFCANGGDQITDLSASSTSTVFNSFIDPWVNHAGKTKPLVFVRGNHEYRGSMSEKVFEYLPHSSGEFYYTFSHGPAHFFVFDSGEDKSDSTTNLGGVVAVQPLLDQEYLWFKKYVESNTNMLSRIPFKIVLVHQPDWGYQAGQNARWDTVANEAGVDILIAGHTHSYSHSNPSSSRPYHRLVIGQQQLCKITVSSTQLKVSVVNSNGGSVDSFIITTSVPITVQPQTTVAANCKPFKGVFKAKGSRFAFPKEFGKRKKSVAVYTLTGRLVYKAVTTERIIQIAGKDNAADGLYIVRVTVVPETK